MYIYKYNMSYNINLVPNIAPQGTVMQYAGATDPSGWTICDGQARSNASGTYNNILTSQLVNVPNANTTLFTAPFNPTGSLLQTTGFNRVSLNGDGTILFTLIYSEYLYISYNSGNTWKRIINGGGTPIGFGISISNNGNVLAYTEYISGKIYVSTNSGVSFKSGPTSTYSNWGSSIVMSGDGSFMLTGTEGQGTFISINSGSTWANLGTGTNLPAGTTSRWLSISNGLSPNGYYVAMFGNATELYLSTNTGNWWSNVAPIAGKTWYTNAISGNGKYIIAGSNEYLYLSSNTGTNWTPLNNAIYGSIPTATKIWTASAMNFNGNYMVAVNTTDSSIYISSNYGNWWTTAQSPTTFPATSVGGHLAMSPFGSNVFACNYSDYLYLSTNNGYSWNKLGYASATNPNYMPLTSTGFGAPDTIGYGNVISVSQTGEIMAAASQSKGLYVSTNSGNNWKSIIDRGTIGTQYGLSSISMTYSGSVMVACSNSLLHISTNYGDYWRQLSLAPVLSYNLCSISGNGNTIVGYTFFGGTSIALSTNGGISFITKTTAINSGGGIYISGNGSTIVTNYNLSTDSGSTWRAVTELSGQTRGISASNDGTIILAGKWLNTGELYLSTNSGKNWTLNPGGYPIGVYNYSPTMSGDGKVMAVATNSAALYISTNSGANWLNLANYISIPSGINGCFLSNDGTKLLASVSNGPLYVSNQAFSSSTYFSSFTPMNLANTSTTDGTTLKYIMKY